MRGKLCGARDSDRCTIWHSLSSLAQERKEHETLATILAKQIQTVLNANSVLGKPQDFEGTKVIPIVKMGFKFGAGSDTYIKRRR